MKKWQLFVQHEKFYFEDVLFNLVRFSLYSLALVPLFMGWAFMGWPLLKPFLRVAGCVIIAACWWPILEDINPPWKWRLKKKG